MQIEWWYWIIAGFCLIGIDLIIPSFTIIWFGVGALAMGAVSGLWFDIPAAIQVVLWLVASVSFTLLWFKYLKPKGDRTQAGIVKGTDKNGRGIVKFRNAVLGADEWGCISDEVLHVGDHVRVVDVEGQVLKVELI